MRLLVCRGSAIQAELLALAEIVALKRHIRGEQLRQDPPAIERGIFEVLAIREHRVTLQDGLRIRVAAPQISHLGFDGPGLHREVTDRDTIDSHTQDIEAEHHPETAHPETVHELLLVTVGELRGQQVGLEFAAGGASGSHGRQLAGGHGGGYLHRFPKALPQGRFPIRRRHRVRHQVPARGGRQPALEFACPGHLHRLFLQSRGPLGRGEVQQIQVLQHAAIPPTGYRRILATHHGRVNPSAIRGDRGRLQLIERRHVEAIG